MKYLVHPKIWRPKPCLLMFASLVALDGFHHLLFTQLTADLTLERRGRSRFYWLSHIYTKVLFVVLKQLQTMLWIVEALLFWIDCEQTQHPLWTQLSHWQKFMQNGEYTAFWYLQLLWFLTQLQFMIGQNKLVEFLVFSRTTAEFGLPEHSASFVSVRLHLKSAYHFSTIVSNRAESI